jgi:hypothetical protein
MHARNLVAARFGLLIFVVTLLVAAGGCSDDTEDTTTPPATETATPQPADETSPSPDASPTASGGSTVNGVIVHVTGTGLDGQTYQAAQPINCVAYLNTEVAPVVVEANKGKVCIDFARSAFSGTEGVMQVLVVGTDDRWDLTLELQDLSWVVTGAGRLGE